MGSLLSDLEAGRPADPVTAARQVLRAVFPEAATSPRPGSLPLARFQAEAAGRILRILRVRGGALLADSVGLGKTHVALAVIAEAVRRGTRRVLIVTPAALRRQWSGPLRRLASELGGHFAGPASCPAGDLPVLQWMSHARLSRGALPAGRPGLVVVDEAHAFRNPGTRRYRSLAGLCATARVLLLTATPVNNSLSDLYFLLRLFLGNGQLADLGVADLRELLRPDAMDAEGIAAARSAVAALTVRRTRELIGAAAGSAGLRFPVREGCFPVGYDLAACWATGGLERLVELIAGLRLDVYDAAAPGRGGSHLLRAALLKRLESSLYAFDRSVARLDGFLRACTDGIPAGRLPSVRDVGARDAGQIPFAGLMGAPLPADADAVGLLRSATTDLDRVATIRSLLRTRRRADPKLEALLSLLSDSLAGRSVLVFTEFADTARAIHGALAPRWPAGLVTGREARLGTGPAPRRRVIEAFAPSANGVRVAGPERIRILVATDVLSEGLNLQEAGDLISYDLPWNPVRLAQRAGRIDRPGSPHRSIRVHIFMPDRGLDAILGLMARIRSKLVAIRFAGGFDAPTLPDLPDHELPGFIRRLRLKDPDLLRDLEIRAERGFELEERARRVASSGTEPGLSGPDPGEPHHGARAPPLLATLERPAGEAPGWLAVTSDGSIEHFLFVRRGRVIRDRQSALRILTDAASRGGPGTGAPDSDHPGGVTARQAVELVGRQFGLHEVPADGGTSAAGRAAHLLFRQLAAEPGGPSREMCARADAILDRLRAGLGRGPEADLEASLRTEASGAGSCDSLLTRLEDLLAGPVENGPWQPRASRQRLVGLFRLRPATGLVLEPDPR